MMTIDEGIKHLEEIADFLEYGVNKNNMSVKEHRQLAAWLKELKKYRAIFKKFEEILADNGYTIDDLDTIFGKVNKEVNADDSN